MTKQNGNTCGYTKADGEPCELPNCRPDGRCWHHTTDEELRANGGRPHKLTYENQETIATVIEQGGSISEAARKVGVHRETIGNWLERGQDQDEGLFADFFDRLTRAKGQGEGMYRQALLRIALENEDVGTLMAMLKQRYPEAWGDVKRGEQTGATIEIHTTAKPESEPDVHRQ